MPRRRLFSAVELHAVAIGSVGAAVLILGWGFDIAAFRSFIPGFPTMKAVTAAGFMLLSMSCVLTLRGSRRAEWGAVGLAMLVIAGALTHQLLDPHRRWDGMWAQVPSAATVIGLCLAAAAMMIVILAPRLRILAAGFALLGVSTGVFRIITMVLFTGAPTVDGSPLDTMSLPTAVLLVWFMCVCVLFHPALGFSGAIFKASLRGRLLRRALPLISLAPLLAAAVALAVSRMLAWPDEALFAAIATLSVMLGVSLIWFLSDIVERWQAEAGEHAAAMARANEALEQYAATAAHDLKAPARHVLLYGELLEQALAKGDIDGARRHAHAIRDSASELPELIESMLAFSRSGATQLDLGQHRLGELVQGAAAQLEADIRAAGAQVVVARNATLICDGLLMTTVFQNLIGNSLKNRRRNAPPVIRIDATEEDARLVISVEDNGAGFDPDFAVVAFNPLARGVRTAGEGVGIGLATCRTIIQSHGGEIRVDPTFRPGARIEIILPLERDAG